MTVQLAVSEQISEWQSLGFVPGPALRMFGMRRSGNHAISNWMLRNAPFGRSVFLNNCKPGANPLDSFRSIEVGAEHASHRDAMVSLPVVAGPAGNGALLLVSYEDCSPAEFASGRPVSGRFDESLFSANILIYRSFLNWAASLLKKMQGNPGYSLSRRCSILLRTFERYALLLGLVEQARDLQLTCISYDRWCAEDDYRASCLTDLGLTVQDNSLGAVQRYGGGSSFQKDASDAADLQSNRRWQQMAEDPEFQAILHLAARDEMLMAPVSRLFPEDAAILRSIGGHAPMVGATT